MNKAYVVLRKGFEYDDSIYSESEGGSPKIICFSIEDAENKIKELNSQEFQQVSIIDYTWDLPDILNVEEDKFHEFNNSLIEKYGKIEPLNKWQSTESVLHPKANKEEIDTYLGMIDFSFYYIAETDIDIQGYRQKKLDDIL